MSTKRTCGSCAYWMKNNRIKGLCDKFDLGWAGSDHQPHTTTCWTPIRDDKPRVKLTVKNYDNV